MPLERGSLGENDTTFMPLATGFTYEPYDEKKHGLGPEIRATMEKELTRLAIYHVPEGEHVPQEIQDAWEDYEKNGDFWDRYVDNVLKRIEGGEQGENNG